MGTPQRTHQQGTSPMDFSRDISEIKVAVQRIESSMVTRAEIEADMNKRVTLDVYTADKQGMLDRLIRLENNPQKMIAWISAGVGCFGIIIAAAGFLFSLIAFLINHK
jgi:hypothetical protein